MAVDKNGIYQPGNMTIDARKKKKNVFVIKLIHANINYYGCNSDFSYFL